MVTVVVTVVVTVMMVLMMVVEWMMQHEMREVITVDISPSYKEMTNVFPHTLNTFNNKNSSLLYIWLLLRSVINRSICFCLYNNYGPIFQNGL